MNERAAQALFDAERRGVRQIREQMRDEMGGLCAMGVILAASAEFGMYSRQEGGSCPLCGATRAFPGNGSYGPYALNDEASQVTHLNDFHGLTFSEIARKLGPDSA